jgi:hypothetical protein
MAKAASSRNMDVPPMENRTRSDMGCLAIAGAPISKNAIQCVNKLSRCGRESGECERCRIVVTTVWKFMPDIGARCDESQGRRGAETIRRMR